MITKVSEAFARTAIASTVALIAIWYVLLAEPVDYLNAEVSTPVVAPGDRVVIIYTRDKKRSCKTEISQFIVNEATGEAVWRVIVPGGYGLHGLASVRMSIPTAADWPVGAYVYRPTVRYECGPFTIDGTIPPARFELRK